MQRPDILVLGAGGTIGAAWMSGVLAGIADASGIDWHAVEHLVGTSAGSMLAADLLAGVEPRAPAAGDGAGTPSRESPAGGEADDDATSDADRPAGDADGYAAAARGALAGAGRLGLALAGAAGRPLAPLALAAAGPGGALLRARALARIAPPRAALDDLRERIAGHGLRFDGRLRVVCVERESGKRVVFGTPGAPPASVAEAVQASCSVPWVHHPVRIGEHEYVDGAIWSPTNLDAAPALRDTRVLCLSPTGGALGALPRHPAIRAVATTAATLETLALRRRGASVQLVTPPPASATASDAAAEHVRLTGYRQGLVLGRNA